MEMERREEEKTFNFILELASIVNLCAWIEACLNGRLGCKSREFIAHCRVWTLFLSFGWSFTVKPRVGQYMDEIEIKCVRMLRFL